MGIAQQRWEEEKSFVNKEWMFISQMKPCYYKEVMLFLLNLSKNSSRFLKWLQSPVCGRGRIFAVCVVCLKCCTNIRPLESAL